MIAMSQLLVEHQVRERIHWARTCARAILKTIRIHEQVRAGICGVCSHMNLEIALRCEGPRADIALERLLTRMNSNMNVERTGAREPFGAEATRMLLR